MRIIFFLFLSAIIACVSFGEEKKDGSAHPRLIYPTDLISPLPNLEPLTDPTINSQKKEFVEIESEAYPGLDLKLPEPEEMLSFQKFELRPIQRGPGYYQTGGPVLSHFGILEPGGELLSTSIPLELEKE